MNEKELITYYNKFNEDKRLNSKHATIEFKTALKYIEYYLNKMNNPKIIDVGAGTGKYSLYLSNKGYDVTAIELIKHNLKVLQEKNKKIKSFQGNAINLSMFKDNTFDLTLLFGPMYHLISKEDKITALNEAKRITKPGGIIMISYCMNEYAVLQYAFIENNINKVMNEKKLDSNFHIKSNSKDLYSYVRLKDINFLKNKCQLKRLKIVAQDGPSEYLKKVINNMTEKELEIYFNYHLKTCEDKNLIGASRHILDILQV